MTPEERCAQALLRWENHTGDDPTLDEVFLAVVRGAVAEEREECARVCEAIADEPLPHDTGVSGAGVSGALRSADRIRARGTR